MIANSTHVAVDKVEELKPGLRNQDTCHGRCDECPRFLVHLPDWALPTKAIQHTTHAESFSGIQGNRIQVSLQKSSFPTLYLRHLPGHDFLHVRSHHILLVFAQIILVILVLHIVIFTLRISVGWRLVPQESFCCYSTCCHPTSRHLVHHHQQPPFR